MIPELGVLTLANKSDYKKAIGLALSLKMTNPGLPVSIVCKESIAKKVEQYFDHVIIEKSDIKGFQHKIFLDHYTPYRETFFFDADILIFKDLSPIIDQWAGSIYTARGWYLESGLSSFGLDRKVVLKKINKKKFVHIGGAGCKKVFLQNISAE